MIEKLFGLFFELINYAAYLSCKCKVLRKPIILQVQQYFNSFGVKFAEKL